MKFKPEITLAALDEQVRPTPREVGRFGLGVAYAQSKARHLMAAAHSDLERSPPRPARHRQGAEGLDRRRARHRHRRLSRRLRARAGADPAGPRQRLRDGHRPPRRRRQARQTTPQRRHQRLTRTLRNIHARIASDGPDAPYWTPEKEK